MAEREIPPPMTVSVLTAQIKGALETKFTKIFVEAEISGWKLYPSGHAYFTLKDDHAQISAVMFASNLSRCKVRDGLKDGAKVIVYGSVSVYPPRGNYQLMVLAVKLAGEGDLMQRYLELKAKLLSEGLFAPERKRKLPPFPRKIGIVTSEAGAVIHDMCDVFARRFPNLHVRLYPSLVQGADAPATLIAGIEYFNRCDWSPDILIVARGGGSFEDLFCFNDERLIRAVAGSRIPTISAVGHETDYTLCDLAADVRAGTPSIAAEIAVPKMCDVLDRLEKSNGRLAELLRAKGEWFAQRLDQLDDGLFSSVKLSLAEVERRLSLASPKLESSLMRSHSEVERRLAGIAPRLESALKLDLQRKSATLERDSVKLSALSPYSVLERGYSLTTLPDGTVVKSSSQLSTNAEIVTRFREGSVVSRVVQQT